MLFLTNQANLFEKIEVQSVVDWTVNQIVDAIIDGRLEPDDRIPSEANLCEQLGVGRNSVREAIKILSAYGIIEQRGTGGTFVRSGFSPKMLNSLIYGIVIGKSDSHDLVSLRRILEKGILFDAIENATDEDIEQVRENLAVQVERVKDPTLTGEELARLDIEFHERICDCTHNKLLSQMFSMINKIMMASRRDTQQKLIDIGLTSYTIHAHEKLYETLLARDKENAEEVVEYSLLEWGNLLDEDQQR